MNPLIPRASRNFFAPVTIFFGMMQSLAVHRGAAAMRVLPVLLVITFAATQVGPAGSLAVTRTLPNPPFIVMGFVGGFVRHNDLVHSTVQLAARLRKEYPSGVYVETFANRNSEKARAQILQLLDLNHDGKLSAEEKQSARIILYGHSWGASKTVALARELQKSGILVLLTVQVDSVTKPGENDQVIPSNVAEAANFYQPHGFVHGRRRIRAADPSRTQILGNFRFEYSSAPINCERYPWYDRFFVKSHTEIECDPKVWDQVESLIRSKLPPVTQTASVQ